MKKRRVQILLFFFSFAFLYSLLNYIPFAYFLDQIPFLVTRLVVYFFLTAAVIFFKHKLQIEVEKPHQQIGFAYLFPFLFPCLVDLIYCEIFHADLNPNFRGDILTLEIFIDFFDSIFEDVVFVDIAIALLFELIENRHKRNLKSILISSLFFSLIRCYVFLYNDPFYSLFSLCVTFAVTFSCGYLAIYYDSPLIPIAFHLLFNILNFVLVPLYFSFEIEVEYYLFNSSGIVLLCLYTLFLYHYSDRKYHKMHIENS